MISKLVWISTVGRNVAATLQYLVSESSIACATALADIDLPVSSVRFVDGTVNYADARTQRVLIFKVKDGAVNWSSLGSGLSASAECEWRGESIDLSLSLTDPAALLAGGRSDIRSKATSDLVRNPIRDAGRRPPLPVPAGPLIGLLPSPSTPA